MVPIQKTAGDVLEAVRGASEREGIGVRRQWPARPDERDGPRRSVRHQRSAHRTRREADERDVGRAEATQLRPVQVEARDIDRPVELHAEAAARVTDGLHPQRRVVDGDRQGTRAEAAVVVGHLQRRGEHAGGRVDVAGGERGRGRAVTEVPQERVRVGAGIGERSGEVDRRALRDELVGAGVDGRRHVRHGDDERIRGALAVVVSDAHRHREGAVVLVGVASGDGPVRAGDGAWRAEWRLHDDAGLGRGPVAPVDGRGMGILRSLVVERRRRQVERPTLRDDPISAGLHSRRDVRHRDDDRGVADVAVVVTHGQRDDVGAVVGVDMRADGQGARRTADGSRRTERRLRHRDRFCGRAIAPADARGMGVLRSFVVEARGRERDGGALDRRAIRARAHGRGDVAHGDLECSGSCTAVLVGHRQGHGVGPVVGVDVRGGQRRRRRPVAEVPRDHVRISGAGIREGAAEADRLALGARLVRARVDHRRSVTHGDVERLEVAQRWRAVVRDPDRDRRGHRPIGRCPREHARRRVDRRAGGRSGVQAERQHVGRKIRVRRDGREREEAALDD